MSAVVLSSVMMQWIFVMVYIFVKYHPIIWIYRIHPQPLQSDPMFIGCFANFVKMSLNSFYHRVFYPSSHILKFKSKKTRFFMDAAVALKTKLLVGVPSLVLYLTIISVWIHQKDLDILLWEARFLPKNKTLIMPWSSTFVNSWDSGDLYARVFRLVIFTLGYYLNNDKGRFIDRSMTIRIIIMRRYFKIEWAYTLIFL